MSVEKILAVVLIVFVLLGSVKTFSCVLDETSADGCRDADGNCAKGSGECYLVPTMYHGDQCCCSLDEKCQWILPDSSLVQIDDEL